MDMMKCDYIADCFYEIMHDYMRYYHWKNGRFRVSYLFQIWSIFHHFYLEIIAGNELKKDLSKKKRFWALPDN